MLCTLAEAWIYDTYRVRYSGDKEDTIKPRLGVRHCPNEAVTGPHDMGGGCFAYRCKDHPFESH